MNSVSPFRARVAWLLFDNATIPFFVLIMIFIFGPYFVSHVAPDPITGQQIWGYTVAVAGFSVALLAPILGAIADKTGYRKIWIGGFSILIVGGLVPLYFAVPGGHANMPLTLVSLGVAFFGVRLATTFNNGMLPHIVPSAKVGQYSGYGTAVGNIGGLILIIFVLGFMAVDHATNKTLFGFDPIFGLDAMSFQGERATALLAAGWFCMFVTPLFLFAPDTIPAPGLKAPIRAGMSNLRTTLRSLPQRKSYMYFLISVMFYRNGISSLYTFGGIYAASVLDLPIVIVGIFGILAILFGVIGGIAGGLLDGRFGPKWVAQFGCLILALDCLLFISTSKTAILFFIPIGSTDMVMIVYLAAGAIAGFASNAVQAASRSLLVRQVDITESTEAFGLYDLASRVTAFTGPLSVALLTQVSGSQRVGILPIVILLLAGVACLQRVDGKQQRI